MTDSHDNPQPAPHDPASSSSASSPQAHDRHVAVENAVFRLRHLRPALSSHVVLDPRQKLLLVLLVLLLAVGAAFNLLLVLMVVNALAMFYYLVLSAYKFFLIDVALGSRKEIEIPPSELASLVEADLPVYTILVPLYREAAVLDELLGSLARLDYPTTSSTSFFSSSPTTTRPATPSPRACFRPTSVASSPPR